MTRTAAEDFALVSPPREPIFRIGRQPNPFTWRRPTPLINDSPAGSGLSRYGNRFDAPAGDYATLYCATSLYACLLEKFASFRLDVDLEGRIDAAVDVDEPPLEPARPRAFPRDALEGLTIGRAQINSAAWFVDVDAAKTLYALERWGGEPVRKRLGVPRIDRGVFLSQDRRLTRHAGAELHDLLGDQVAGIRYSSVLDGNAECWAIWEHAGDALQCYDIEAIDYRSPDLGRVAPLLGFVEAT